MRRDFIVPPFVLFAIYSVNLFLNTERIAIAESLSSGDHRGPKKIFTTTYWFRLNFIDILSAFGGLRMRAFPYGAPLNEREY